MPLSEFQNGGISRSRGEFLKFLTEADPLQIPEQKKYLEKIFPDIPNGMREEFFSYFLEPNEAFERNRNALIQEIFGENKGEGANLLSSEEQRRILLLLFCLRTEPVTEVDQQLLKPLSEKERVEYFFTKGLTLVDSEVQKGTLSPQMEQFAIFLQQEKQRKEKVQRSESGFSVKAPKTLSEVEKKIILEGTSSVEKKSELPSQKQEPGQKDNVPEAQLGITPLRVDEFLKKLTPENSKELVDSSVELLAADLPFNNDQRQEIRQELLRKMQDTRFQKEVETFLHGGQESFPDSKGLFGTNDQKMSPTMQKELFLYLIRNPNPTTQLELSRGDFARNRLVFPNEKLHALVEMTLPDLSVDNKTELITAIKSGKIDKEKLQKILQHISLLEFLALYHFMNHDRELQNLSYAIHANRVYEPEEESVQRATMTYKTESRLPQIEKTEKNNVKLNAGETLRGRSSEPQSTPQKAQGGAAPTKPQDMPIPEQQKNVSAHSRIQSPKKGMSQEARIALWTAVVGGGVGSTIFLI